MAGAEQPSFDFGDEPLDDAANPTLTVSELAETINRTFRRTFPDGVWVRGEITGWSERGNHAYFALADDAPGRNAHIRVQFFANVRARLRPLLARHGLHLGDGMKVRIFGGLDFYAPSATLGLKMTDLDPRFTLGDLAAQRSAVMRKLAADGTLNANHRRPSPVLPLQVGVVASTGTAAWHDFHDEIARSGFGFRLVVADTRVQGPDAPRYVARAIASLSHHATTKGLDVIVVIRGGGAKNELATFDAEPIARAIAAAPVAVFTGLGHETDRSIADEAAHSSFKTPTACASELVRLVADSLATAERSWAAISQRSSAAADRATDRLDVLARRIGGRTREALGRAADRLDSRVERVGDRAEGGLRTAERHLTIATGRLAVRPAQHLDARAARLDGLEARVRALDPVNVMARGWSITRTAGGRVIRDANGVTVGTPIVTHLRSGTVASTVTASSPHPSRPDEPVPHSPDSPETSKESPHEHP